MAGRLAAAGHRADRLQPDPRARPRRSPPGAAARPWPTPPARPRPAADVVIVSLADDAAVRAAYGGDDGLVAGLRPGHGGRRHQHGRPGDGPRRWRPTSRATGAALLDTPVSGSVSSVEGGTHPGHGRRRRRTPSSGPGRCSSRSRTRIIHARPARAGRDDEARRQRDGVRAQPDPRRGAGAGREGRRRARAGLRGVREQRGRRAVRAATSGRRSSTPSRRRSRSPSTWSPRTSTSPPPSPTGVGAAVPQLETNRRVVGDAIDAGLGDADLSALAVHLRGRG